MFRSILFICACSVRAVSRLDKTGFVGHAATLLDREAQQLSPPEFHFPLLDFSEQSILTAPRVYFAMAEDGVFFRSVARVHPRTRVPVIAIALQGLCAIAIALTGTYAQVINYVVAMDCIFFGLTAICLFLLRQRTSKDSGEIAFRVPGHPWTTILFILAQWTVVASTFAHDPKRSFIGLASRLPVCPHIVVAGENKRAQG